MSAMVVFRHFKKLGNLRLVDHFVGGTKIFLEVIGQYNTVKQEFSLDSTLTFFKTFDLYPKSMDLSKLFFSKF